jgi:RND family efflux transporter MFP subunit
MSAVRICLLIMFVVSPGGTWAGGKLAPVTAAQRTALHIATIPLVAQEAIGVTALPAQVIVPPEQERVVATPIAGLISEVRVAVGDKVRAGQPLAVLRSEELVGAQRDIVQAAVQDRLAADKARRDEGLFKEGIIPESRVQASRAEMEQARAMLGERRAWLRLMGLSAAGIGAAERGEKMADSIVLSAPIAGTVMETSAVTGARVAAASALFKVAKLDPLWLDIQVPADIATKIKPGQKVELSGTGISGAVLAVGSNVNAAQTVSVRARISNGNGLLRLNQNVTASLLGAAGDRQWLVPVQAVVRQGGKSWIFIERGAGFEPTVVNVLSQSTKSVAIDGAFKGGEQIAVEGVAALKSIWQGTGE